MSLNWVFRIISYVSSARQAKTLLWNARAAWQGAQRTFDHVQTAVFQEALRKAQQGDAEAQFDCGERYFHGDGVPQDDAEAFRWFLKGAEQGHVQAQASTGLLYAIGRGVEKNLLEAYRWISLAAAKDERARRTLQKLRSKMNPSELAQAEALSQSRKSS